MRLNQIKSRNVAVTLLLAANRRLFTLGVVALLLASLFSVASAEQDGQIWTMTNLSTRFDDRFSANLEVHYRFFDGGSDFGQRLIRPSVTYDINKNLNVSVGYVQVLTEPTGRRAFSENRPWQQIGYTLHRNDYGFIVSGRTRYEQRFVEGGDEMGNRFRQFLRLDIPFKEKGKLKAVLWNETFLNADDTDWGQRAGIDQVRNFAGLGIPVTNNLDIEAGYLNQLVNRPGENLVNHAFSTYFNVRF